jgi:pyruvate dehydrogenase E2 component (dihydrolipoamide acetyltransferase)
MATPGDTFDGNDFLLPDLGEGLEEAEIIEWNVEPGAAVEEGDALALVETGKAQTELMAPRDGVVAKLHVQPGERVKVGSAVVEYAALDGEASTKSHADAKQPEPKAAPAAIEEDDAGSVVGALAASEASDGKPLATPAVRRKARDLNVNLHDVAGTGMGGRITARDVEAAADRYGTTARRPEAKPAAAPATQPALPHEVGSKTIGYGDDDAIHVPIRGLRRTIADRLRESVDRAVHFTVMDEADVTKLESARKRLVTATGIKISLLPFVCAAVAKVLAGEAGMDLTRLNSTVDDAMTDIARHRQVHLGIAVDTSDGLMVPVLRDVRRLGVMEIGEKIAELAAGCRSRSLSTKQLSGGTFTISNFGSYPGGRFATPILNYPEAAILAVGRARDGVVVRDGLMGVGKQLPLSLTCDHRVVDGGTAVGGLNAILQYLQSPDALMPQG